MHLECTDTKTYPLIIAGTQQDWTVKYHTLCQTAGAWIPAIGTCPAQELEENTNALEKKIRAHEVSLGFISRFPCIYSVHIGNKYIQILTGGIWSVNLHIYIFVYVFVRMYSFVLMYALPDVYLSISVYPVRICTYPSQYLHVSLLVSARTLVRFCTYPGQYLHVP